jgi:hypothetical protein
MRALSLFFALLCWCGLVATCHADFDGANRLYDEGKFAEAKSAYLEVVVSGQRSANLFYNLGNTEHRLGAEGEAQLNYQRALALDPAHPEARANLNLLRGQSSAVVWPSSWLDQLFPGKWLNALGIAGAVAAWIAVFSVVALVVSRKEDKTGIWSLLVLAVLVTSYAGGAVWHGEQQRGLAVIVAKSAEVHFAPAESSAQGTPLTAGSEVRILSARGDWIYCALPTQGRGWITAKALAQVRLGES